MTDGEFGAYMDTVLADYAAARAAADRVTREAAEEHGRRQHTELLPGGRLTAGHHFLRIVAAGSHRWLGGIWLHTDGSSGRAWLYNITVFPEFRRQGVARRALALVQERARELGCRTLALNVFATNPEAMSLYRGMGFDVVSSHMNKAL